MAAADDIKWEAEQGLPQLEDTFIQTYMKGRQALIDEEHKQRHGQSHAG